MKKWEKEQLEFIYKSQGLSKKEIEIKIQNDIDEEKDYRTACQNVGKNYEEEKIKIAMQEMGMTLEEAKRYRRTGKEPG
jgi:hypothetical protein